MTNLPSIEQTTSVGREFVAALAGEYDPERFRLILSANMRFRIAPSTIQATEITNIDEFLATFKTAKSVLNRFEVYTTLSIIRDYSDCLHSLL